MDGIKLIETLCSTSPGTIGRHLDWVGTYQMAECLGVPEAHGNNEEVARRSVTAKYIQRETLE